MRLSIRHTTRVEYERAASDGVMLTRLGPLSDEEQRWDSFELQAGPHADIRRFSDGFGNAVHLITAPEPHQLLEVTARSLVWTLNSHPAAPPPRPPRPLTPLARHDYLAPSALVPHVADLEHLAEPLRPSQPAAAMAAVQGLMRLVHEEFAYERRVTTVATTVAEVVRSRRGVCQDFTHVLIGLCRAVEIPARYVSGYLIVEQPEGTTPEREWGARVASHAWVEAYTPTHGWRGFDPTNNRLAGEDHVKMATGRDYADVPPTRGTSRGGGAERLTVDVAVDRAE